MDRDSKGIWLQVSGRRISFFWVLFISLFFITLISSSMEFILYTKGIDRSLKDWEKKRVKVFHDIGIDYLKHGIEPDFPEPISIYGSDKKLLITNRRNRKMMMNENLLPVRERDGKILGYISTRAIPFKSNSENRELLESIVNNILLSSIVSMFISLLLSFLISSRLSQSAKRIREAIGRIKVGEELDFTPTGPRELTEIGYGVRELVSKLNSEEKIRNQWIHDISHDLKTPVTSLKIQFESMLHGNLDITRDRIEKNSREIERLEELVLSINELMSLESPDYIINMREIVIEDLIFDLTNRFNNRTDLRINNISKNLYGDYNLVLKALSNLIDNGIVYSKGGNWVDVTFDNNSIIVSNPGDPIPEEEIGLIFDRLYRGDLSRHSRGAGIGLSIVKAAIEKHGWSIKVTSDSGVNSFIVYRI